MPVEAAVKNQLVLSLFPGIDLFGHAFELEGFCVVQGPEIEFGRDIKTWNIVRGFFTGIIGGPPCQMYSPAAQGSSPAEDLIPEFVRAVVMGQPSWFGMENVRQAPVPQVPGYAIKSTLIDAWHYGARQKRIRRFTLGYKTPDGELRSFPFVPEPPLNIRDRDPDPFPTVTATEHKFSKKHDEPRKASRKIGRTLQVEEIMCLMGVPDWPEMLDIKRRSQSKMFGNGVELHAGRVVARAIKKGLEYLP